MPYTTITVLTDGALEEEHDFPDTPNGDKLLDAHLKDIERKSRPDMCNCLVEVYRLYHPHPPLRQDEECGCIQHLSDLNPEFTYNTQED